MSKVTRTNAKGITATHTTQQGLVLDGLSGDKAEEYATRLNAIRRGYEIKTGTAYTAESE